MNSKGKLSIERKNLLESLQGWNWSLRDMDWDLGSSHLKEFFKEHAHSDVSFNFVTKDGFHLGKWVEKIRNKRNLSREQRWFLNLIQFDFKNENSDFISEFKKVG